MPTLLGIGAVLLVCFVYPSAGMWLFGLLTLALLAFIFSKMNLMNPMMLLNG